MRLLARRACLAGAATVVGAALGGCAALQPAGEPGRRGPATARSPGEEPWPGMDPPPQFPVPGREAEGALPLADQAAPGWRMTADFEPLAAVWLSYDAGHEVLTRALINALRPHVALKFLVASAAAEAGLRALLNDLDPAWAAAATVAVEPHATFFLRDLAVFASGPSRRLGVVDFRWSEYGMAAWCMGRFRAAASAACAADTHFSREDVDRRIARLSAAHLLRSSLAIEGGGVEVNGRGLLIANEALWRSRNPHLDRAAIEKLILRLPGVSKVLWLPEGLAEDPHLRATITGAFVGWGTGGHTDEFVRFADARTVLLAWPETSDVLRHPVARLSRARMQRCFDLLSQATTAQGQPLRVVRVPMPVPVERRVILRESGDVGRSADWMLEYFAPQSRRQAGQALTQLATASYLNFVVANGVVVLPDYVPHGTPPARQERVRRLFETAFAGRQVRFADAISANWVGGGLHCATLSQP